MHKTWKKPLHKRKVVSSTHTHTHASSLPLFQSPTALLSHCPTPWMFAFMRFASSGRRYHGRVAWSITCSLWWSICLTFGCSSCPFRRCWNAFIRAACSSSYCYPFCTQWWYWASTMPCSSTLGKSIWMLSSRQIGIYLAPHRICGTSRSPTRSTCCS